MDFSIKLVIAVVGGFLIGIERELRGKSAGLKTNSLVALGACIFVLISMKFYGEQFVDHTRVIGQVVSGIGFIGAGTILQTGNKIEGLTTAATIWCSAGVGCLAALNMLEEVAIICVLVLLINFGFTYIEKKFFPKSSEN